ncbi:hypothetical protein ACQY0O_008056 [Thecaphora frezii]
MSPGEKPASGDNDGHQTPRRRSTATSRRRRSSKQPDASADEKPAYDVLLSCRTADPIADAHNHEITQLPAHWVPTLLSNLSRAASQHLSALSPEKEDEEERRFAETHKPSGSWKRRMFRPAQEQQHSDSLLPRLAFKNPWESYRAPGLKDMLNGGLKWGLPAGYQEGGEHRAVFGNKLAAGKKIRKQERAGVSEGLEEGWDRIEVRTPDWGWPSRAPTKQEEEEQGKEGDGEGKEEHTTSPVEARPDVTGHANGDAPRAHCDADADADAATPPSPPSQRGKATSASLAEWCDPENNNLPAARVTWLGHATTLLQLPSLADDDADDPEAAADTAATADANEADERTPKHESDANREEDGEGKAKRSPPPSSSPKPRRTSRERIGRRSVNILFDPIFSERCSPSQSAGPQRFTRAPCQVDDLPPIDIVCISHSHFDHLDALTMKALARQRGRKVHAFVGLGLKERIVDFGWAAEQVSELDWWDSAVLQVHGPKVANVFSNSASTILATAEDKVGESRLVSQIRQGVAKLRIVCTPAQHGSGRGGDKDQTLWCSWTVEWIPPQQRAHPSTEHAVNATFRAFFAGDTGLKYHKDSVEKRNQYPPCPAFAEIAKRIGRPDLLLLPISVGSSLSYFRSWDPFPRSISPFPRVSAALTSSIHMDPYDAVETHEIMRSQKDGNEEARGRKRLPISLAVHYGTFVRNNAQTEADVRQLHDACRRAKLAFRRPKNGRIPIPTTKGDGIAGEDEAEKGSFLVTNQGETVWIPFVWQNDKSR